MRIFPAGMAAICLISVSLPAHASLSEGTDFPDDAAALSAAQTVSEVAPADMAPKEDTGGGARWNWPEGADALTETYGDWTFQCRMTAAKPNCSLTQRLLDQTTGKTQFAIEIQKQHTGDAKALLIMPFGLRFSDGVTLLIDDQQADQRVNFSTCLPDGCVVPFLLATGSLDRMKGAGQLRIRATEDATGKPAEYSIRLKGISEALTRFSAFELR